ncbi:MAG TPA: hypothetical protein VF803_00285, partial [Candidatus Paceibacterota bacterium]
MFRIVRFLIPLALLSFAPFALAIDSTGPAPVEYIVAPQNPGPHSTVYIQINGVGNFLGNAMITWTKDGQVVAQGYGRSSYSFTTGALGETTELDVMIDSSSQGPIEKTFVFNPSLVSLVWEGNTTVPPFYAGKPLASPGSLITVYAFPTVRMQGTLQSPGSLSYQWKINDQAMPAQSGVGRSSITLQSDQLHSEEDVSVAVYTPDGTAAGSGSVSIPMTAPKLVLYAHDPLRGILYGSALSSSFSMSSTEMTVHAEPFFFSQGSGGRLQYSWQLNGSDTSGPRAQQGELTLRQSGGGKGN